MLGVFPQLPSPLLETAVSLNLKHVMDSGPWESAIHGALPEPLLQLQEHALTCSLHVSLGVKCQFSCLQDRQFTH